MQERHIKNIFLEEEKIIIHCRQNIHLKHLLRRLGIFMSSVLLWSSHLHNILVPIRFVSLCYEIQFRNLLPKKEES